MPLLVLTALFASILGFPVVRASAPLTWTLAGVAAALFLWELLLLASPAARARGLRVEFRHIKAHSMQAAVQLCIYVYWGWHWPQVFAEAPLIVAQAIFFYVFTGLLAWTRGRVWQVGFGPLPIILSTNLLFWFRHDWFYFQFAMLAAGALGKEFVRWRREGRLTHIFNPSVFGQTLAAVALIATGTTTELSRGEDIAASFEQIPHIFWLLFGLGLLVQYHFSVTLVTLSAVGALCLWNLVYTQLTGGYWFTTLNVGATVFLGAHLLITDPSTSPRTNLGRLIFGAGYGIGYALLFRLFENQGTPLFWDKLLPVPILNLSVPLLDRLARSAGLVGRLNEWWETALAPRRQNLVHMAGWAVLFGTMIASGFIDGPHEGRSLAFWQRAHAAGVPRADRNLLALIAHRVQRDDGEACNVLGKLHLEGVLREQDPAAAAHWFARACRTGYVVGCENVAGQFFSTGQAASPQDVKRALDSLEQVCGKVPEGNACYLAGLACELGVFRAVDPARARAFYEEGCSRGDPRACERLAGLAARGLPGQRIVERPPGGPGAAADSGG